MTLSALASDHDAVGAPSAGSSLTIFTVPKTGWYDCPSGSGARWWTGQLWSEACKPAPASQLRSRRILLLIIAGLLSAVGSLLVGPQAFGFALANSEYHSSSEIHAGVVGLFAGAVLGLGLLLAGILCHVRPRSARGWRTATFLLIAVVVIELTSLGGCTEYAGMLFG